jgi:hypothetical protein
MRTFTSFVGLWAYSLRVEATDSFNSPVDRSIA